MALKKTYDFVSLFKEYAEYNKRYTNKTYADKTAVAGKANWGTSLADYKIQDAYTKKDIDEIVGNVATNADINLIFQDDEDRNDNFATNADIDSIF